MVESCSLRLEVEAPISSGTLVSEWSLFCLLFEFWANHIIFHFGKKLALALFHGFCCPKIMIPRKQRLPESNEPQRLLIPKVTRVSIIGTLRYIYTEIDVCVCELQKCGYSKTRACKCLYREFGANRVTLSVYSCKRSKYIK